MSRDIIDKSTYKEIVRDKKAGKSYSKGEYGHSKYYRNIRIVYIIVLLMLILMDVIISQIVFHTRKTPFIIIACILAIPFARNIIDLIMSIKATPLSKDEYDKIYDLSRDLGFRFYYDISITDEDGMVYIPCVSIRGNNIIAYTPDIKSARDRERLKKYIMNVSTEDISPRIVVTDKYTTFEKEVNKLRDSAMDRSDSILLDRLLSMGF